MSKPHVTLDLTHDQALVLFDWLVRESDADGLPIAHQAEQSVLWVLEGQLEKSLAEPLKANYTELVRAARACLTSEAK